MQPKTLNVLIAEDDTDDQSFIKSAFASVSPDINLMIFSNGIQLLNCLLKRYTHQGTTFEPDLILLDLNMPVMDGYDVLREINKHEHLRSVPVYVVTNSRDIDELQQALELGARGFYSKGASMKDIKMIVNDVCKRMAPNNSKNVG